MSRRDKLILRAFLQTPGQHTAGWRHPRADARASLDTDAQIAFARTVKRVARQLASLDHLSKGRAGWNVVTSSYAAEAFNYSRRRDPPHSLRYRRAKEFVDIVKSLWDSWDDDAFLFDEEGAP